MCIWLGELLQTASDTLQSISFASADRKQVDAFFIVINPALFGGPLDVFFSPFHSPHIKMYRGSALICANLKERDSHYVSFIYLFPAIDRSGKITIQE